MIRLERTEIIRDMRLDVFDVLVGINLLREGLDIPEITLVAILDADKEDSCVRRLRLFRRLGELPVMRMVMLSCMRIM